MTPIELEAYDAMMKDRDNWRELAEHHKSVIRRCIRALTFGTDLAFATETTDSQHDLAGRACCVLESALDDARQAVGINLPNARDHTPPTDPKP